MSSTATAGRNRTQFIGFVLVGIVSTVCNLSARYAFEILVRYEWALLGAYVVGVLSAFFLNRWFVFTANPAGVAGSLMRFTLVNLVGIALGWVTAVVFYRQVFPAVGFNCHTDLVAHAIGIAVPVLPNYVAHKRWTFSKR